MREVVGNLKETLTSSAPYMAELAAEVRINGNPEGNASDELRAASRELRAAHERRQAFIREMHAGTTERARIVRRALAAQIYGDAIARDAMQSTLNKLEQEQRDGVVADMGLRLGGWS